MEAAHSLRAVVTFDGVVAFTQLTSVHASFSGPAGVRQFALSPRVFGTTTLGAARSRVPRSQMYDVMVQPSAAEASSRGATSPMREHPRQRKPMLPRWR